VEIMPKPDDRKAKAYVRERLATACGITLTNVKPEQDKKNVDFEMMDGSERVLVAELKTIEYHRASADTGWEMNEDEDGFIEACRVNHNAPARLLEKISDAYKQVSAYPHPWAVIMHNQDIRIDISDLHEAFSGERVVGKIEDRRIVRPNYASYGRTLKTRYEIDLYIWVDELDRPCRLGVWSSTPIGKEIAERYFSAGVPKGNFPARWPRPRPGTP
jgi:hypothetical protein